MISGNKVKLRAIEPHDIDLMYQWENDLNIWSVSGTTTPFSKQMMKDFIENSNHDIYTNKQLRLAIDLMESDPDRNPTIGYIDLYDFEPTHRRAGVGILIADQESRRQGFGLEAINLLCEYAFNIIHLHQLFCNIQVDNDASIRLFSSAGFNRNGELEDWTFNNGAWVNVYFMQKVNT